MPSPLTSVRRILVRTIAIIAISAISATTAHADIIEPPTGTIGPPFYYGFGQSLAVADLGSTNYLAVGTKFGLSIGGIADAQDPESAAVFIYRRSALSNSWVFEQKLLRPGPGDMDSLFGYAIAMRAGADGSLLVAVGAPGTDGNMGAAHIFRRSVSGELFSWNLEATLTVSGNPGDYFGDALAISPDLTQVAIAASFDYATGCGGQADCPGDQGLGNAGFGRGSGNVFVYKKSGSTWSFSGVASIPIPSSFERHGSGLAYGNTTAEPPQLLVGAMDATDNGVTFAGRVYVVRELTPNTWSLQQTISGGTVAGVPMRGFGKCLQVSGNLAIVGAPLTNVGGFNAVGRALTLVKDPITTTWSLRANLLPPSPTLSTANSFFGDSVSVHGDMIVIGTKKERAFLYRSVAGALSLTSTESLTYPASQSPIATDAFGASVAIGNGTVAVGVPNRGFTTSFPGRGAVSVFDAFPGKIMSDDPSASEGFGTAVAVGNQRVIIGVPKFDGTSNNQGRIEIFERFTGGWFRIFSQTATDPIGNGFAGNSVAITDDGFRFAFGALGTASASGAVYGGKSFVVGGGTSFSFSRLAFVSTIATAQVGELLGSSVAMTNQGTTRWIVAGAPGFDSGGVADRGRILIWRNEVMIQAILGPAPNQPSGTPGTGFGRAVAIESYSDGTVDIVVGAPLEDVTVGRTTAIDCGSIHIYRKAPTATTFSYHLTARHGNPIEQGDYGAQLALKKSRLVVGCPERSALLASEGAVFAWTRSTTGVWSQVAGGISGSQSNERFGSGVSTDGTNVLAGAPGRGTVGAAQLLKVNGSALTVSQTFTSTDSRQFDLYGSSVALGTATNGPIVIGCNTDTNGDIASAGSAYGFLGPGNACASDLDGDFSIGTADLSLLLTSWGLTGEDASGVDINLDGIVDAFDLSEMLHGWGTCGE